MLFRRSTKIGSQCRISISSKKFEEKVEENDNPKTTSKFFLGELDDDFERPDCLSELSNRKRKKHHIIKSMKCLSYDEKRDRVIRTKEMLEDADLQRKFLLLHKKEINKHHVTTCIKMCIG